MGLETIVSDHETKKNIDKQLLNDYSIKHKRDNGYKEIDLSYAKKVIDEALKNEDYFNAIEDEQLEDVDMVRFSADPVYSKTQFACLSNDLDYDEKHYENIKQIDEFISDKSIIRLIIACGRGTRANYVWFDGTNEWLYVVEFPKRQLTAVIDRKSIQIRKLEGAL